jgi:polyhydroxyalkanoate synthase
VFCLSWKNPAPSDRDHGMEDYLRLGLFDALDAINAICPKRKVHAVGYCLGGTLLAIGAAAMARDSDDRLASLSLLAAQTDFSEPATVGVHHTQSAGHARSDDAAEGVLDSKQMGGAFAMLRSPT